MRIRKGNHTMHVSGDVTDALKAAVKMPTEEELRDTNKWIPFTQYLRPYGRKMEASAPTPSGYGSKVAAILAAGMHFEVEVLTTGIVSQTVSNGEEDIVIELSANDSSIESATKRLIDSAFNHITGAK